MHKRYNDDESIRSLRLKGYTNSCCKIFYVSKFFKKKYHVFHMNSKGYKNLFRNNRVKYSNVRDLRR